MQVDEQNQSRVVDMLHNQDKVLKESLDLYNGCSLEFLDAELSGKVTAILGTELTETTTKKSFADKAFEVINGGVREGVHKEWQAKITKDDMMRFASCNVDLSRTHKIDFTTVVITAKKPSVTGYKNKSVNFTPKLVVLSERDADRALADIDKKIQSGEHVQINPLEIIYLPLYGSKSGKTTANLLDAAIKLTPKVFEDKNKQQKLQDLLILLTVSFISDEDFRKILEANMRVLEDSTAVRVLGEWFSTEGKKQEKIEIAEKLLRRGRDIHEVAEDTGLSVSKVSEMQAELQSRAV